MDHWITAISDEIETADGPSQTLYGYDLRELTESVDFTSVVYLALTGQLPPAHYRPVLDAVLVSGVVHGVAASGAVTRLLAACGIPLQVSVASGALTFGDTIGGAGEQLGAALAAALRDGPVTADLPAEDPAFAAAAARLVQGFRATGRRVPGFGHPLHRAGDPRAAHLLRIGDRHGVPGVHTHLLRSTETELARRIDRRIPVNLDGAITALAMDMGIAPVFLRPMAVISRSVGNAAHAVEQQESGATFPMFTTRFTYTGPAPRRLPDGWTT